MKRSRAFRRHHTKKWKIKRKDHHGDRCKNPKCGLCSFHKRFPGSKSSMHKHQLTALEAAKDEMQEIDYYFLDENALDSYHNKQFLHELENSDEAELTWYEKYLLNHLRSIL